MSAETVISKPGTIAVSQSTTSVLATCDRFDFTWPATVLMTVSFTDAQDRKVKVEYWVIPSATRYLNAPIASNKFIDAIEEAVQIIMNDVINNGTPTEGHDPNT
jgi:hypothetical protein